MKKVVVTATVRLNTYGIIADAVENGITAGWYRAHKHTNKPTTAATQEAIHIAVMGALADLIDFGP